MKSVLIGACVALAAGLFGATGASADWRESVLRNKVYDSVEQAPKAATRTRKARSARRAASYDAPSGLGAPRTRSCL